MIRWNHSLPERNQRSHAASLVISGIDYWANIDIHVVGLAFGIELELPSRRRIQASDVDVVNKKRKKERKKEKKTTANGGRELNVSCALID